MILFSVLKSKESDKSFGGADMRTDKRGSPAPLLIGQRPFIGPI